MPALGAVAAAIGVTGTVGVGIVSGVVYGALIGGVTAAIKKENVLKGALKGGLMGAVTGGLVGAFAPVTAPTTTQRTYGVLREATGTSSALSGAGTGTFGSGEMGAAIAPIAEQVVPQVVQSSGASFLNSLSPVAQQEMIKQTGAGIGGMLTPDPGDEAMRQAEYLQSQKVVTPVSNVTPTLKTTAPEIIAGSKVSPAVSAQTFIDWSKESYKKGAQPNG